jgi:glycosyltransferase involved in cell wall biosynthesis
LASSAGGASEIVIQGRNGFLVAPGDVAALAASIEELIRNRERLLEMSLAARRTFLEHPTWADGGRMIYDFLHHFGT